MRVDISDCQTLLELNEDQLRAAIQQIVAEAGITSGDVSLAVVDDAEIHELNRQFLEHDYPTDVLSFVLEHEGDHLEGEIIVSVDTASRMAEQVGWTASDELLLYVIHGALHLVGYDDQDPQSLAAMRAAERKHLAAFGLERKNAAEEDAGESG